MVLDPEIPNPGPPVQPLRIMDWAKIQRLLQILAAMLEALKTPDQRALMVAAPDLALALDWTKLLKLFDLLTRRGPELMSFVQELLAIFDATTPLPAPPQPPTPQPAPGPSPAPQP